MPQKKAGKNRQSLLISGNRGLIVLFAVLLITLFTVYAFSGCDIIPGDIFTLPGTGESTGETGGETEPEPTIAPVVDNPVLITEIQSANQSTLQTDDQATPDWIELFNSGTVPVNLKGYGLSDKLDQPQSWTFPDVTIRPGEYLVVYASGLTDPTALEKAAAAGEIHASFRLARSGEELIFTNPAGQVLARLAIPEIPVDLSWGLPDSADRNTDPFLFFAEPTPGRPNGPDGHEQAADAIPVLVCDLVINEYVTRQDTVPDPAGSYSDWVEFYNSGSEPFRLLGCTLSDDPDDPGQWSFPDITVEPGAYLLVWLSGLDSPFDPARPDNLHASFRLGETDDLLILTDSRGRTLLSQPIEYLPLNVSHGRSAADPAAWLYFPGPTPGRANTTQGFEQLDGALLLKHRGVWINEVVALDVRFNGSKKTTGADWIELYNGSDTAIDLTGYGLSDDPSEPFRQVLDGKTLAAGAYLVIEPEAFGLSPAGETLLLTAPGGQRIDRFETGALRSGMSSGRGNSNGDEPADSRFFYAEPTRGSANSTPASQGIARAPLITAVNVSDGQPAEGLYLDEPVLVSLLSDQPGAIIRYTLDGSMPRSGSPVYSEPLLVDRTTVIRCIAVMDYGLPSRTAVRTFLSETRHDLPVVSIIGNASDFFDPVTGIWTNYAASIEHPADIDFYEADGIPGIQFTAGINLHGSYSRTEKQKSMELKLRTAYGDSQVTYPFFPGNEVATFKRLILRTSGQDWRFTKLRDAFMTEVIMDSTELDTMDWRPCVVYINGAYYGLYYLREKVDQYYMASHHGTDPDQVDIIKGNKIILNGSYDAYGELLRYVKTHDMRQADAYQYVLSQIDEHSLMDFVIAQTFFNNLDSGNKKFWCERKEGAEWRWVFFDLDWAMFPTTYQKNILKYDLLDPAGHGQQDIFDSTLQVKLMENDEFRTAFIERYAWFLNHVFTTERMLGILDHMTGLIRQEMPRQIERWGGPSSITYWENQVAELRRITSEKRERVIRIVQETFNLPAGRMQELFPEDYP